MRFGEIPRVVDGCSYAFGFSTFDSWTSEFAVAVGLMENEFGFVCLHRLVWSLRSFSNSYNLFLFQKMGRTTEFELLLRMEGKNYGENAGLMCLAEEETVDHLLLNCKMTQFFFWFSKKKTKRWLNFCGDLSLTGLDAVGFFRRIC